MLNFILVVKPRWLIIILYKGLLIGAYSHLTLVCFYFVCVIFNIFFFLFFLKSMDRYGGEQKFFYFFQIKKIKNIFLRLITLGNEIRVYRMRWIEFYTVSCDLIDKSLL